MIDKATIDQIMDTAQILDVVSEFVTLRRRGANFVGLCPFHNEKTPSFSVSPLISMALVIPGYAVDGNGSYPT